MYFLVQLRNVFLYLSFHVLFAATISALHFLDCKVMILMNASLFMLEFFFFKGAIGYNCCVQSIEHVYDWFLDFFLSRIWPHPPPSPPWNMYFILWWGISLIGVCKWHKCDKRIMTHFSSWSQKKMSFLLIYPLPPLPRFLLICILHIFIQFLCVCFLTDRWKGVLFFFSKHVYNVQ